MRICCVTKSLKGLLNWRCYLNFVVEIILISHHGSREYFFFGKRYNHFTDTVVHDKVFVEPPPTN